MNGFTSPADNAALIGLHDGMVVADLGAGTGHYCFALSEMMARDGVKGTIYAVDVQKALLERLRLEAERRKLGNIQTLWGDFDTPGGSKLGDHICDAVILSNVLFQSEHRENLMKEVTRILKPGGQVLMIDWTDSHSGMGPHPDQVVTKQAGREMAEKVGLSVTKEFDAGSHHWGLLLKK